MINQVRRDTKNTTRLPACLEHPLTPLGLSGNVLNEQVCVDGLVISYQKRGRTDQTLLI